MIINCRTVRYTSARGLGVRHALHGGFQHRLNRRSRSSPVAAALAGLRANEARYFKNKYDHIFTVEDGRLT